MSSFINIIFIALTVAHTVICWESLPNIPTGRRSEYYVLHENGGYKYGYDTGDGIAAKQAGDSSNQVEGHYFYTSPSGKKLDLKYTAGIQGFVPVGLEKIENSVIGDGVNTGLSNYEVSANDRTQSNEEDDQSNTGDSSYKFNIDTDTYKREETADSSGNVQGSYSYINDAGTHDLKYIAGSSTGFLALSGSLSQPNGLLDKSSYSPTSKSTSNVIAPPASYENSLNADGSYSFGFSTDDQTRQEVSDSNGNVKGSYSYINDVGNHDLSYVAGADLGFQVTGGSLANPNGLGAKATPLVNPVPNAKATDQSSTINDDGSYSFSFSTADQTRNEKSDSSGNVEGAYSYKNDAGNHDLSYVAGANTGFEVTGGSLSVPNGLGNVANSWQKSPILSSNFQPHGIYTGAQPDGSYSFGFSTADQSRNEQADSKGNVQGGYSFRNTAGTHDLTYIAGSSTGFHVTGGSLAAPSILQLTSTTPEEYSSSSGDQANTDDASYNFKIDTDEYQREESADASGNVKGSFSYKNAAGRHDLNYIAGADTGFLATGGSLSVPNGLIQPFLSQIHSLNDIKNSADGASYSFNIDTDDYKRKESSDSRGNVQGNFSYKNNAGTHDLSYIAGSSTGFQATGGSLSTPPGLAETQLRIIPASSSLSTASNIPATKNAYSIGKLSVRTYLPPSNEKHKFGYILDTKY